MQFYLDGYVTGDPEVAPAVLPAEVDVLVVGTGPAGVVLAAQLVAVAAATWAGVWLLHGREQVRRLPELPGQGLGALDVHHRRGRLVRGRQGRRQLQRRAVGGKAKAEADHLGALIGRHRGEPAQRRGDPQRAGQRTVAEDLRMQDRRAGGGAADDRGDGGAMAQPVRLGRVDGAIGQKGARHRPFAGRIVGGAAAVDHTHADHVIRPA